jgi:hypothetical protein
MLKVYMQGCACHSRNLCGTEDGFDSLELIINLAHFSIPRNGIATQTVIVFQYQTISPDAKNLRLFFEPSLPLLFGGASSPNL